MHVDVQIKLDVPAMQKEEETHNQQRKMLVGLVG
jgi:lipase chaperone LimK